MTDPAIQEVIRQRIAIHGATAETRDKTMALIDAWGAEREAAGAVEGLERVLHCDATDDDPCPDGCDLDSERAKAEAHYQTCQNTLKEIMAVDGRSE